MYMYMYVCIYIYIYICEHMISSSRSGAWRPDICKCPLSMDGRLAGGFAEALEMLRTA